MYVEKKKEEKRKEKKNKMFLIISLEHIDSQGWVIAFLHLPGPY